MLGATLGNMIGGAFESPDQSGGGSDDKDSPAQQSSDDYTQGMDAETRANYDNYANDITGAVNSSGNGFENNQGVSAIDYQTTIGGIDDPSTVINVNSRKSNDGSIYTDVTIKNNTTGRSWDQTFNKPPSAITTTDLTPSINQAHQYGQSGWSSNWNVSSWFYSSQDAGTTLTETLTPPTTINPSPPSDFEDQSNISFSAISFPGAEVKEIAEIVAPKISFGAVSGWSTVIGAVVGGIVAYVDQDYDCSDETQMASYTDYAIFLQGESISVTSADGDTSLEREVPSDAGALNFTLGGVSPSWDFSNADHSSVENVGIKFTNTGLNDPLPKYGTLTINATTNRHGKEISLDNELTQGRADVYCDNANFGEYWIGAEEEAGLCTGVSKGNYSQKYHVRVVSAEPKAEEAYLKKESVCYNGTLTGATGSDAVPKVLLEWDWDSIDEDTCAYGNPDYVYCDATQFSISLVKRLAELDSFFETNSSYSCPEDPILTSAIESYEELNNIVEVVGDGFIGASEVEVSVIDDKAVATVTVENNTGADVETYASIAWKGEGEPINDQLIETFPAGESEVTFEADIPKYAGVYFFTIVFNGPSGNRRVLTEAFRNPPVNQECWAERSTRSQGGVPAITYYMADQSFDSAEGIDTGSDLFNRINFGAYLMRDAYSEEFFRDFSSYYLDRAFERITENERKVLEYMSEGRISITKRFSEQERISAGLYDVWLNIDFGEEDFLITENVDSEVDASLLLVKSPSENFPFYNIPFNGSIGENGRQGYGATYTNEDEEIVINDDSRIGINPSTFEDRTGNGIVSVTTAIEKSFDKLNSSPGTRGQLMTVSFNGNDASIVMSPNYATPIIAKYVGETGDNYMRYKVSGDGVPVISGGNLLYWTGAAKSRDLYGAAAIDVYNESPDFLHETGETYGFFWDDVTQNNTMYLKTIIYSPTEQRYMLTSEDPNTTFLTPNSSFSTQAELIGIRGMTYNSESGNTSLQSINDLFNMVKNRDVCISNDGSIASFWWNPRKLATTRGSVNSLEGAELGLVGVN
jgi:hypothetical protein